MKFTVKNSRSCGARDGIAWSADIYIDGVKAISAQNSGCGGPTDVSFYDRSFEKPVMDHIKTLPPYDLGFGTNKMISHDLESFVEHLVDDYENLKQVKRWCKKKTLIRLNTDEEGKYTTFNLVYSPKVKEALIKKFGDKIIEFTNEVVANS